MSVALGSIGQNLMTAFTFNEFSFSPEFGIELDDYVLIFFIFQSSVFTLDFKPLLGPFLVNVRYFATHFEAALDLGDMLIFNLLEVCSNLNVITYVSRCIDNVDVGPLALTLNINNVILFPFLKVIFYMLIVFFTFNVMRD